MAVRKTYPKGKGTIHRRPFVGDPAERTYVHNPEPTTARGRRRSENTYEYQENCKVRKQMSSPCSPTVPRHRGPSHRPKGTSKGAWEQMTWDHSGRRK